LSADLQETDGNAEGPAGGGPFRGRDCLGLAEIDNEFVRALAFPVGIALNGVSCACARSGHCGWPGPRPGRATIDL
jgi:hypothetical protein